MHNYIDLSHKTILVTGASSGIGKQVAITCSELGASVIITGRNNSRLLETMNSLSCEFKQNHISVCADLNTDDGISLLTEKVDSIDGAVFCAGINDKYLLKFIKRENIDSIFNTNVFSPILICKNLHKLKKINTGASIIFISSISSTYATISNALYASSKGAINSLIRTLALELSSKKIRVNGVTPGMIKTGMLDAYDFSQEQMKCIIKDYPLGRLGEVSDVANAVAFFLSDVSSWITGTNLVVDGGVTLR